MNEPVWRRSRAARPLLVALVLVALQIVALLVVMVVGVAGATSSDRGWASMTGSVPPATATGDTSWGLVLFALLGAGILALLGWAATFGHGWARGPLVTVEILAVLAGISTATNGQPGEGVALAVPAALITVLLFLPGVVAVTTSEHQRRGAYSDDDDAGTAPRS